MGVTVTDNFTPQTWGESYPKTWGGANYMTWMFGTHDYGMLNDTTLTFVDLLSRAVSRNDAERVFVDDGLSRKAVWRRTVSELVSVVETYWDLIQFRLGVSESLSVTESHDRHGKKNVFANVCLNEHVDKSSAKKILCVLSVSDNFARTVDFFRPVEEQIAVLEEHFKHTTIPFEENFPVMDSMVKAYSLFNQESVTLSEFLTHVWDAKKELAEYITINDLPANHFTKPLVDSFMLFDAIMQASQQILNNIIVSRGAISLAEFQKLAERSPGFSDFIEFKVGEYDYQEALVKIKTSCAVEQAKPSINNLIMHVDIPDTDDRGTATIGDDELSAPKKVYFNQPYYNPPEVNVVLRTGNTGSGLITPFVVSITNTYFEVEIRNQSMDRVKGTISWVSKGY